MVAKTYTCLKCGKTWVSGKNGHPKQCKYCKRKDWDGLHNSYGRLLDDCVEPVAIRSARGGVACACVLCGGSWVSRSAETVPRQCPKCKKTKWAGVDPFDPDGLLDAGRYDCMKCGNAWVSRIEGLPKICPSCKSNSWSEEALKAAWDEIEKPLMYNCVRRWFVGNDGKLVPHDGNGYHQYSPKTGVCFYCGWNNNTHRQDGVNDAPRISAEEGERRKRQWELEHPGEKF